MKCIMLFLVSLAFTNAAIADDCVGHNSVVFQAVTIVNGDGSVQSNMDVIASKDSGTITDISAHNADMSAACADVIGGAGHYLAPGMVEMHGHLPFGSWGDIRRDETYFLYISAGVTTVRGMLGDPAQFDHRISIEKGEIIGPQLFLAAPSLNGNSVSSTNDARALVRKHTEAGYDLLKIHPGLSKPEYMAMADEAGRVGIPFGGHVPEAVTVVEAMEQGQVSLDHMDGYLRWKDGFENALSDEDLAEAVELTRKHGTWVVPTQELFNIFLGGGDVATLRARAENAYMPARTIENWASRIEQSNGSPNIMAVSNRQRLLKALVDGDANVVMGSDAPQVFSVPGFSIWREIDVMKDAGVSDADIFRIATIEAGRYFGKATGDGCFGLIAKGCRADMVLLRENPLNDINAVKDQSGVMIRGRWLDRKFIDEGLRKSRERHAR